MAFSSESPGATLRHSTIPRMCRADSSESAKHRHLSTLRRLGNDPNNTIVLVRAGGPTPYILFYPGRSSQQGLITTPAVSQLIPSEDGSEIYVFDQSGRHFSTLDSLTGAAK